MNWLKEYLPQLVYWLVTGAFAAICAALARQIQKNRKENEATNRKNELQCRLLKALAQNVLYRVAENRQAEGYCTMAEKRDLEHVYGPYSELGWNGVGKAAFEIVMELPNSPQEKIRRTNDGCGFRADTKLHDASSAADLPVCRVDD